MSKQLDGAFSGFAVQTPFPHDTQKQNAVAKLATRRQDDDSKSSPNPPGLLKYSSMGMELTAAIVGFTLVGYWIDQHFESSPKGTITGATLGVVGGMYNLIRESLNLQKLQDSLSKKGKRDDDDNSGS